MIAYLSGKVAAKQADSVILDVGGVGFLVLTNPSALAVAKSGEPLMLHTRLVIREDSWDVYGFLTKEEVQMFDKLTSVSGVGPRTALGVLSNMSVHDLALAIVTGDAKAMRRAPGIGAKTAQRLLLELKDKVENEELVGKNFATAAAMPAGAPGPKQDAIAALMALGYDSSEAASAVSSIEEEGADTQAIVRQALRSMARLK